MCVSFLGVCIFLVENQESVCRYAYVKFSLFFSYLFLFSARNLKRSVCPTRKTNIFLYSVDNILITTSVEFSWAVKWKKLCPVQITNKKVSDQIAVFLRLKNEWVGVFLVYIIFCLWRSAWINVCILVKGKGTWAYARSFSSI